MKWVKMTIQLDNSQAGHISLSYSRIVSIHKEGWVEEGGPGFFLAVPRSLPRVCQCPPDQGQWGSFSAIARSLWKSLSEALCPRGWMWREELYYKLLPLCIGSEQAPGRKYSKQQVDLPKLTQSLPVNAENSLLWGLH